MHKQKILVRLPNWLGDMVMSVSFIRQVTHYFPGATISVIAKEGIQDLLDFFPLLHKRYIFSKKVNPGLQGAYQFGKQIANDEQYDIFFSLPDSFSSAWMGWATKAIARVGYKNELRQVLLTNSYKKGTGLHRVDQYNALLSHYSGKALPAGGVYLNHDFARKDHVVININSEASSRRLTPEKAIDIISSVQQLTKREIQLIGAPKEQEFVHSVFDALPRKENISNLAGKTNLKELIRVLGSARAVLSTDSGPAHLSNALGTNTVVLFGAGNELHTAPYNVLNRTIIRLGKLSCEPCEKNICKRYGVPQCLQQLSTNNINVEMEKILN